MQPEDLSESSSNIITVIIIINWYSRQQAATHSWMCCRDLHSKPCEGGNFSFSLQLSMRPPCICTLGALLKWTEPRHFSRGLFLQPSLCAPPPHPHQPRTAWLCAAVQEWPITPDCSVAPASEWGFETLAVSLQPQLLTGESLGPFWTSTKHLFRGPLFFFSTPLSTQLEASCPTEPGRESIQHKWAGVQPADLCIPKWNRWMKPEGNKCSIRMWRTPASRGG